MDLLFYFLRQLFLKRVVSQKTRYWFLYLFDSTTGVLYELELPHYLQFAIHIRLLTMLIEEDPLIHRQLLPLYV